ncbi:pyridoxamine 5'-phosphate oxidase family protein [Microtetraspora sp. AC03309]|uniref:pyridoxamine 5'-phosphate oxidase family protein n=1 Tax=Microtetraspora sp. AC03309 TaxID=2779376 RepID=UPI001E62E545|nr:pyridoxamine 5'-phosphate oxidase family protein [Microtetraspora sp. AC03309]MCC5576413.1 pyridoxamine 5'-phosphate oxidase family protein [Microtetraspora sp. AC03309]
MNLDMAGLQELSRAECLSLLSTTPIGRVVFTERALPAVQVVNYMLDGEDVVFRTTMGSRLSKAARGSIVAFEADHFDPVTRRGWSVTAVGPARLVEEPGEVLRLARLPLVPWGPGHHDQLVSIRAELVTGRRLS